MRQADIIARCLAVFCSASGQRVSNEKSVLFCSKNTPRTTAVEISDRLGFSLTDNLGRYLGVPILHERTSAQTYQGITDRISNKLSGWKAKSLSLAGRVTLAQSVLAAILAFVMQTAVIPITTCEAIDRLVRNFVWGSSDEVRKVHLVSWEQICKPKDDGGLGLKMARHLNRAYMMKLAFIFFQEPQRLWVQVLQGKYLKEDAASFLPRNLRSQSVVWKGICCEWGTMLEGAHSAVRNGQDTNFWTARWVDSGARLIDTRLANAGLNNTYESVVDFVNTDGQWDVERLLKVLPPDSVFEVVGMSPPREESGADQWVLGGESNGSFSIKSAYGIICREVSGANSEMWNQIWSWSGPNRIRCFLWLALQEKLLSNCNRVRRRMAADASCDLCRDPEESVVHILLDCSFAADSWVNLGSFDTSSDQWGCDFNT
ncbi:Putative ribonuclease H protein At1g65750 [Linum perenne]